jgi:hypothetical protein
MRAKSKTNGSISIFPHFLDQASAFFGGEFRLILKNKQRHQNWAAVYCNLSIKSFFGASARWLCVRRGVKAVIVSLPTT